MASIPPDPITRGGGAQKPVNSSPSGNFKNDLLTISLVAPGEESGRFYDLTPGHVSDAQRNAVLARLSSAQTESVSPRHADDSTHLLQFTIHQENSGFGAHFLYLLDTLEGTSQPFVAYTPEILIGRSPHNGVTTPLPILEPGNNVIVYRWTVTDSSQPLDVALQPTTLTKPEFAFQTLTPTGNNEVTLTFNLNRTGDASSAQVQGEVTLNGQHLASIDSTTNPDLANLLPLFRCTRSGHYHLTMTHNGTIEVDEDYVQRSLPGRLPGPALRMAMSIRPSPSAIGWSGRSATRCFPPTSTNLAGEHVSPGTVFPVWLPVRSSLTRRALKSRLPGIPPPSS